MELELESMTEAYVLSLGEAQFDSCPLSTCHALRSALPDAAPSQSRLKALLKEVSNRARLWNVLLLFVGRSAAELSPAPSGLLHLRETGRGQDGSGEGADHGSNRLPLRLRVFPVRLSLPSELPRHPSARQVLHHRGRGLSASIRTSTRTGRCVSPCWGRGTEGTNRRSGTHR